MPKLAPKFTKTAVVEHLTEQISLEQYKNQWVVLVFIPLAFTFVCPTEIIALNEALAKFENRATQVLIASTDSEFALAAWNKIDRKNGGLGGVRVPLLADTNLSLSQDYGVLVPEEGIALRGTFLISPEGEIVHENINDTPVGRSVDEIIRVIDAFQFVREHGEGGCKTEQGTN